MRIGTYYYEWKQHVRFKLSYRVLCIIRFGKIKGSLKQLYLEFENMFLLYLRYLFHFSNSSRSGSFSRRVDIPSLKRGGVKWACVRDPTGHFHASFLWVDLLLLKRLRQLEYHTLCFVVKAGYSSHFSFCLSCWLWTEILKETALTASPNESLSHH